MRVSLRKSITIAMGLLLAALTGIFAISNVIALNFVQKRIYQNTEDTVTLYQEQIDADLQQIDRYLYTIMSQNSSFIRLSYLTEEDKGWYSPVSILGRELNNAIFNYKAEAFFDYLPDSDTFILGVNSSTSFADFKDAVRKEMESPGEKGWHLVRRNDTWYLLRMLQSGKQYLGAFVRLDDLLEISSDSKEERYYCLIDSDHRIVGDGSEDLFLDAEQFSSPYSIEELGGIKCLVVHKSLANCSYELATIIPYSEISQITVSLKASLVMVAALILLIWLILVVAVKKSILEPITTINDALQEISAGNLEQRIPVHNQSQEFQSIAKTYNIMVSEIKDLKINVYEQQLLHEKLESQYLKQQITPHFMINCLNTACQLTECGELELARKLLKELSMHLRYVLSSGKKVRLSDELILVQNYIGMSGIRYPDSIQYELSCPRELENSTVVPLMLLNFVENTIKHEVLLGEQLEIHIGISEEKRGEKQGLRAVLWDTGRGYDEQFLKEIRKLAGMRIEETPTAHLGITNVMQRTKRELPGAEFAYANRPGAGAEITIWIPEIPFAADSEFGVH